MDNDLKSISQIARELHVSRQAIYQKIKRDNTLSTGLRKFTVNENNKTLYTLQAQELIKQAFVSGVTVNCKQAVDSKQLSIDSKLIDSLTDQLAAKDEQITALTAQNAKLIDTIDKLTTALQAAQALHGMDKQTKAIDVQAPAAEQAKAPEPHKQPAPRPRSEQQKQPRPQTVLSAILHALRHK